MEKNVNELIGELFELLDVCEPGESCGRCDDARILFKRILEKVCKDQREICAEEAETEDSYLPAKDRWQTTINSSSILNAKMPEITFNVPTYKFREL